MAEDWGSLQEELSQIKKLLEITATDYWHYRYEFDNPSDYKPKRIGAEMVNNIIINSVVPIVFSHGYHIMMKTVS